MGVSIGCGVIFAYELVRYLIAANQVIPKKPRYTYNFELQKENLLLNNQNVKKDDIPIPLEESEEVNEIENELEEKTVDETIIENEKNLPVEEDILVIDE